MKVVCIVQARLNSTRLPRKICLPLAGKPALTNMLERVRRSTKLDEVIVACPANDWFEIQVLAPNGVGCMAITCDENDLVKRHLEVAESRKADIVVRVPSDNFCVEPEYINKAVEEYLSGPYVFYSNTSAWVDTGIVSWDKRYFYVDGVGCEVFSMSRLKWLEKQTRRKAELREHPHQYFYDFVRNHREYDYTCDMIEIPSSHANTIRLDVNTQADYDFIADIYHHFGNSRFHVNDVLAYLNAKGVKVS